MKTSRSLFNGYSKPFGFFILFTMGTLVATTTTPGTTGSTRYPDSTTSVPHIATAEQKKDVNTTSSPGIHSDVSLASSAGTEPSSESVSNTPSSNDTTVESKLLPEQIRVVTTPWVPHPEEKVPLVNSTIKPPPSELESTSVAQGALGDISDMSPSTVQGISQTHAQSTVGQKYPATTSKKKIPSETTPTISTILSVTSGPEPSEKPRQKEEETEMTTVPAQDISNSITTGVAPRNPSFEADREQESNTIGTSSSGMSYMTIILVVVACVLCLLVIIAFLYRRHRRHSGSTSFNTSEWAGQVALPDDSALDKDIEPGAVIVSGEQETKRNTLVTFFGKRQSRVPSVAMDDISGKREKEECQQLLDGDAGQDSGPEGSGEANGKLPQPTTQSSEEASTPSKPDGGSS